MLEGPGSVRIFGEPHFFVFISACFNFTWTLSLTKRPHMNSLARLELPVAKAGSGSRASSHGHSTTQGFCQFCTFGFGFHIQIAKTNIIWNWYKSLTFSYISFARDEHAWTENLWETAWSQTSEPKTPEEVHSLRMRVSRAELHYTMKAVRACRPRHTSDATWDGIPNTLVTHCQASHTCQ